MKKEYTPNITIPNGSANNTYTEGCLVLEGGALRGLYTAGILDVLMQNNINISTVVGTSAGALTGTNYVSGDIGRSARLNIIYRNNGNYIGAKAFAKNRGVIGFKFLFYELNEIDPMNEKRFHNPSQRLIACTTELETGNTVFFEKGKTEYMFKALKASASMPYVSSPVLIEGKHYLDGGCSCKVPYSWALENNFEKIIVIRTRDLAYRKNIHDTSVPNKMAYIKYPKFQKTLDEMNINYNKQAEELEKLADEGRILMISPSEPVTIGRLEKDMKKLEDLYTLGYNDGLKNLQAIKDYLDIKD